MNRPTLRLRQKPKSRLAELNHYAALARRRWSARARYNSSGYHAPTTTDWCPHKTKCPDHVDANAAQILLAEAMRLGMLSDLKSGEWPKNAWAVDNVGTVYEAQLTNREAGEYHGYPMRLGDRFAEHVAEEWENRQ